MKTNYVNVKIIVSPKRIEDIDNEIPKLQRQMIRAFKKKELDIPELSRIQGRIDALMWATGRWDSWGQIKKREDMLFEEFEELRKTKGLTVEEKMKILNKFTKSLDKQ